MIGDKWTLLIVRDLFLSRSRFGEFLNSGEGIPTNILARRLRRLEAAGLVERKVDPRPRSRYAYRLTRSGRRPEASSRQGSPRQRSTTTSPQAPFWAHIT